MFAACQGLKVVVAYLLKVEGLNSLTELDEVSKINLRAACCFIEREEIKTCN